MKFLTISVSAVQAHPEAPERKSCKSIFTGLFLFLVFQSQFIAKFRHNGGLIPHHGVAANKATPLQIFQILIHATKTILFR